MINRALIALSIVCVFCMAAAVNTRGDDANPNGDPPREKTVTRMYDIRGWLNAEEDHTLEKSPHAIAFVVPANDQGGQQGSGGIEPARPTLAEEINSLEQLIIDSIAPESWLDAGGRDGSIREINGILVVTQTAANQKKVAAMLKEITGRQGETVHTYADWIILPHADVSKLLKSQPAGEAKNLMAPSVDPAALAHLPATARHFRAELLCLNGQTVSYVTGRERSVTVNETAVAGTAIATFTPFVGNIGTGIALQVNPTVDRETHAAVVTLTSTFNDPEKPGAPIIVRASGGGLSVEGVTVPKFESTAGYHELSGIVQEFHTTLKMPLDTPVLVGSMSLEPVKKNGEAMELVMIVRVHLAE